MQSPTLYSQIISGPCKANEKTETVSSQLARQIERSLHLVDGYMDTWHPEQEQILYQLKKDAEQNKRRKVEAGSCQEQAK